MNWTRITERSQIQEIFTLSHHKPVLIFKHSTRCSLSSMILHRLEREETPAHIDFYLLDLIAFRTLSDHITETCSVRHESPQVLLIRNGDCIYDQSHYGISMEEIKEHV